MHKISIIIVAIITAIFALFATHSWLTVEDSLRRADAIVAISGGDTDARTVEAVRLYQDGWADTLIFSGAALDPLSPSNAEVMKDIAAAYGVEEADILIAEQATNTKENAEESKLVVDTRDIDSIILVTSPYHQRRALLEFEEVFNEDVEIINHSSEDKFWSERFWYADPQSMYLLGSEAIKSVYTALKNL